MEQNIIPARDFDYLPTYENRNEVMPSYSQMEACYRSRVGGAGRGTNTRPIPTNTTNPSPRASNLSSNTINYSYSITGSPLFDTFLYLFTGAIASSCVLIYAFEIKKNYKFDDWILLMVIMVVCIGVFLFPGLKIFILDYLFKEKDLVRVSGSSSDQRPRNVTPQPQAQSPTSTNTYFNYGNINTFPRNVTYNGPLDVNHPDEESSPPSFEELMANIELINKNKEPLPGYYEATIRLEDEDDLPKYFK